MNTGEIQLGFKRRPPTPYALYIQENASKLHDEEGNDMNEIFRELADKWNQMDEEEKNQYYDRYTELKMEFEDSGHEFRTRQASTKYNTPSSSSKKSKSRYSRANEDTEDESVEAN